MHARIVKFNLKPNSLLAFTETFEKEVLPMLRKESGFQDQITCSGLSGSNEVVTVSTWDRKESADSYNASTYPIILKTLSNVIEGSPYVKTYEVTSSTFAKNPIHATF